MTQLIPTKAKIISDETARHQRLLELIEAEDAANGEVGCGGKISGPCSTRGVGLEDEKLKSLLREHLGHRLMEPDFDAITAQIQHQIESLVPQVSSKAISPGFPLPPAKTTEHIPTETLKELFQSQIAEFCSEDALECLIQISHQIIHQAVLRPRHTWSAPIWVLRGETQIYIVQATVIEEVIAKVTTQHPQETGKLEVITVGGILAPDQVIALDANFF
jgi:hypothetical protein